MVIYLDLMSPPGSSNLPESRRAALCFLFGLASRWGLHVPRPVTRRAVVSYTALPPLPRKAGGIFLLHCPWSRLRQTLSGTLPCEARTFLAWQPFGSASRDHLSYSMLSYSSTMPQVLSQLYEHLLRRNHTLLSSYRPESSLLR